MVELFRDVPGGNRSTVVIKRQFLQLHPNGPEAPATPRIARRGTPRTSKPSAYHCRICGTRVTPQRRSEMQERQLCRRCRHAEYGRERYRDDPEYRAHVLTTRRAQRRGARGRAAS